ncbi:uncharacterized protein FFB14_02133 [Fusarium fujikuroi]|nr:uncharacterized protein FFB14_02133 [Fusarium fujikuroi]
MAPGAAFTMACVLLVYTRSSIHSARDQAVQIVKTTREWRTCTKTWFVMRVHWSRVTCSMHRRIGRKWIVPCH